MKVLLIYNPNAGFKRAKKILPDVERLFVEKGIDYDLCLTEYQGHGREIVQSADFKQYDGLIAAGGDGTLFEVTNGYFKNSSRKKIPIGIVPVGTGNAFFREFNIDSSNWEDAVDIISSGKTRKVDVALFRSHGEYFYFMNIMGLGFVADVTKSASYLKIFGNIAYTLGVLYRTVFLKSFRLHIEIDGKELERENIFVEVSNTRYTSNFLMAPNAKVDDGMLDITLLGKISRRRLLKSFPKIFTGEHIYLEEVETYKAKRIKIETDPPKIITPDGELVGITPVEIETIQKGIDLFWP